VMEPEWAARFWIKVNRSGGCWTWIAALSWSGYGRFQLEGKARWAHRVAWFLSRGEWPPTAMLVCHRCDNRRCVRPDHLFLGTPADNLRDMSAKGRSTKGKPNRGTRGARNFNARLTPESVREIRCMHAAGARQKELAARFGVAPNTISTVLSRRSWAHVA
jgi:HNH endonuclease/helix-turn-helix protein